MVYGVKVMLWFAQMIKSPTFPGGVLKSWWSSLQAKISDTFGPLLAGTRGLVFFLYLITCRNIVKMYELIHSNFILIFWFASVILISKILSSLINKWFSSHWEENLKKLMPFPKLCWVQSSRVISLQLITNTYQEFLLPLLFI